jgi:esterase/lipase superfamily enzyme
MIRNYYKWHSNALNQEMEFLVFGNSGDSILFFPTRSARFFDYENWGVLKSLEPKIESGQLQIICLDSVDKDSFYCEHKSAEEKLNKHLQYENYILQEVIPFIEKQNPNANKVVAGCSMGAFHAVNIAFRHPKFFKKVIGMSGRYDLTQNLGDFKDLFDGERNDCTYFNSPNQFLKNLTDSTILNAIRKLDITIAIGETDAFLSNNKHFSEICDEKHIDHKFQIWENEAHRPKYWRTMVDLYF